MTPNTRASNFSALVAISALGLTGALTGCTLSVEADVPDVRITQSGLAFEGVPSGRPEDRHRDLHAADRRHAADQ